MKMKKYFISISLLSIFVLFGSNAMAGWENWIFSNKKYSNNIIVETYLVNEKQISDLFLGKSIKQPTYEKLAEKNLYLVARLKNTGRRTAWGELACEVAGSKKYSISVTPLGPISEKFDNYVIPVPGIVFGKKNDLPYNSVAWEKLFTK